MKDQGVVRNVLNGAAQVAANTVTKVRSFGHPGAVVNEVKVLKVTLATNEEKKTLAFATILVNNAEVQDNYKVVLGKDGAPFVSYPSQLGKDQKFHDRIRLAKSYVNGTLVPTREALALHEAKEQAILAAYEEKITPKA